MVESVHMVCRSLCFVASMERRVIARGSRTIYQAPTLGAAETTLTDFETRWGAPRDSDPAHLVDRARIGVRSRYDHSWTPTASSIRICNSLRRFSLMRWKPIRAAMASTP